MSRLRRALPGALAAVGLSGLAALAYSLLIEPRRLALRRFRVALPGLPPALAGLRLAYLSDFHAGGSPRNDALARRALAAAADAGPDLVLLGGDYFDGARWERDDGVFAPLEALRGRVFAVLGNHDVRRGSGNADAIVRLLEDRGVCVLRNDVARVVVRGECVAIAGVDDPYTRREDLAGTLAQLAPGERPLILLAHAPSIADELPVGAVGLILAGHTHGGQVHLSWSRRLTPLDITFYTDRFFHNPLQEYQRGFHWVRGALLYVSVGLGTTRWGLRFRARPEVVLIDLTDQPVDPAAPCDDAAFWSARSSLPLSSLASLLANEPRRWSGRAGAPDSAVARAGGSSSEQAPPTRKR